MQMHQGRDEIEQLRKVVEERAAAAERLEQLVRDELADRRRLRGPRHRGERPDWFRGVISGGGAVAVLAWLRQHRGPALAAASTATAATAAFVLTPGTMSPGTPPAYAEPDAKASTRPAGPSAKPVAATSSSVLPVHDQVVARPATAIPTVTVSATPKAQPTRLSPTSAVPSLPVTVPTLLPTLTPLPTLLPSLPTLSPSKGQPCLLAITPSPTEVVCIHPPAIGHR